MNTEIFIKDVLIKEIGEIKDNHPFLAFNLICSGVEFLGKCIKLDKITSFDDGNSYFKDVLVELFPKKYKEIKNLLWSDLRNGMIHFLLPKSKIGLSQIRHFPNITKDNHPFYLNNKTVLIVEFFYDDFVNACNKVINSRRLLMSQKILSLPN